MNELANEGKWMKAQIMAVQFENLSINTRDRYNRLVARDLEIKHDLLLIEQSKKGDIKALLENMIATGPVELSGLLHLYRKSIEGVTHTIEYKYNNAHTNKILCLLMEMDKVIELEDKECSKNKTRVIFKDNSIIFQELK